MRTTLAIAVALFASACAAKALPPPAPPTSPEPSFAEKSSWILRLEDQRALRDPAPPAPPPPPPPVKGEKPPVVAAPPPPPDLVPLLGDTTTARIRRQRGAGDRARRIAGRRAAARQAARRSGSGSPADRGVRPRPHRRSGCARCAGRCVARSVAARQRQRRRSAGLDRRSVGGRCRGPDGGRDRSIRCRGSDARAGRGRACATRRSERFGWRCSHWSASTRTTSWLRPCSTARSHASGGGQSPSPCSVSRIRGRFPHC